MWKEYAVEPQCLVQSRDAFRALFFSFGWENGRLLAQYPTKDWLRMVYAALGESPLGDVARKWVEEHLRNGKHRLIAAGRPYSPDASWLENAEQQQANERPFDAIIACANPRNHASVLLGEDACDAAPLFAAPTDLYVPRRRADMAGCIRGLLRVAKEIRFVDPYFGCLEERFVGVLREMLSRVPTGGGHSPRIEYHLAHRSLVLDQAEFQRRVQRRLGTEVPPGATLTFYLWEQRAGGEILHDRFVLTENGGVDFSVGLDEGEPGQTTKVSRLSRPAYEKICRDYAPATSAFNLRHSFEVAPHR